LVPQVGVLADLCLFRESQAQVSEYRDLWHPRPREDTAQGQRCDLTQFADAYRFAPQFEADLFDD